MTTETLKLAEVVEQIIPDTLTESGSFICENCGYRLKHRDKTGLRRWCKRCIDIYYRKENLKTEEAEQIIVGEVGKLYASADLSDIGEEIRNKLLGLGAGQDVYMFGYVGTGKTFTMAALLRHYVYQGFECVRLNFDDFLVRVRSTMSPASKMTEHEMIKPLKSVDKLFIDDLGLKSIAETDFAYGTFYSILNKRQERMLPTFITTNKTIERLSHSFDARIESRLKTALIIELKGEDRRLLK